MAVGGRERLSYLELDRPRGYPMLHLFDKAKAHWEEKQGGKVDASAFFAEAQHTPQSGHGMLKFSNFFEVRDVLQPIYNEIRARTTTPEEFLPFADTHINENLKVE